MYDDMTPIDTPQLYSHIIAFQIPPLLPSNLRRPVVVLSIPILKSLFLLLIRIVLDPNLECMGGFISSPFYLFSNFLDMSSTLLSFHTKKREGTKVKFENVPLL